MILCDITHVKDIVPGDEVVYLGSQKKECILGDDIAQWADTISYEVFCSMGQKVDREYSQ
jgi:alanine racemase